MSHKMSKISVIRNAKIWGRNLTKFKDIEKNCRDIPDVDSPLHDLSRIPTEEAIIGRFNALAMVAKCRKKRYVIISEELLHLWQKLKLKAIRVDHVKEKIDGLIQYYKKMVKRPKGITFKEEFDITTKALDSKFKSDAIQDISFDSDSSSMIYSDQDTDNETDDDSYTPRGRHRITKTSLKPVVDLVNNVKVTSNKAAKICQSLAKCGIEIPTPSQPGIYKAVIKSCQQKELFYIQTLRDQEWCLHFDGGKMAKKEIQVVLIKNETTEIKLAVLVLGNGKSLTIFNGIKDTLNKFNLWTSIKMIICDTTSVNTGVKNGVVALLQNHFIYMGLPPPQYIGCQHHVLDLILRHVMDESLGGKTSSPNIPYPFISNLLNDYDSLKASYKQNEVVLKLPKIKWRDDMQFLYELCHAYKYFKINGMFPFIRFKALPPISNARWNSRAIFGILSYILLPNYQKVLEPICDFICDAWFEIWFSDHCFQENNFEGLNKALIKFTKAHECFIRHWVRTPSAIANQQRSNICAERGIKLVQDIYPLCKTSRTLNLKFISFNT